MGHYASEMDPNWSSRPAWLEKIDQIEDDQVRYLARVMFMGFDSGSYLNSTNAQHGVNAAIVIDELINARLADSHSKRRLDQLLTRARQNRV